MNKKLLDVLKCPKSNAALIYEKSNQELISVQGGLAYPIKEGIPVLLIDEARPLNSDELNRYVKA